MKMATVAGYNTFDVLKNEFEQAKEALRNVNENIRKLTGRDPKVQPQRKRRGVENIGAVNASSRTQDNRPAIVSPAKRERKDGFDENSSRNRRNDKSSNLTRSRSRNDKKNGEDQSDEDDDDSVTKPSVQSSVVSTQSKLLSRTRRDSLVELKNDKKVMARNRRMFGLLIGTLQKFQTEQTRQKEKDEKRQKIEEKLELAAVKEKEEVRKERRELFLARRKQSAMLRRLEQKMEITKIQEDWEKRQKCLTNFIKTKSKPSIMYLPAKNNQSSEKRLQETRAKIFGEIEQRRRKITEELKELDENEEDLQEDAMEDGKNNEDENLSNVDVEMADDDVRAPDVDSKKTDIPAVDDDGTTGEVIVNSDQNRTDETKSLQQQDLSSAENEFVPVYD